MSNQTPSRRPIKAIIFDHDGTLVDSEPVHLSLWQDALRPFDCSIDAEDYSRNLSGHPTIKSAHWLVERFSLPITPETLFETKQQGLYNWLSQKAFPLMPDALNVVRGLHEKRVPLAVASGAGRVEVTRSLTFHGLMDYFPFVTTRDDAARNKPAPDIYLRAAELLEVAPEHCLAIEDSDSGQQSATAAGMHCLRLPTYSTLPPQAQVDIIPSLSAIEAWLTGQDSNQSPP